MSALLDRIIVPARVALNRGALAWRMAKANPSSARRSLSRTAFNEWKAKHPELHRELSTEVRNRYEAARMWQWGNRSLIYSYVNDARFDAFSGALWEMRRKARYFEENCALVQRIADVWEQYTVGPNGLLVISDSDDEDWGKRARDYYYEWSESPDLCSSATLPMMQSLASRLWLIDGECFIIKTRTKEPPYRARIQLIEAHRCSTPDSLSTREGSNIVDGVEIQPETGKPVAYWFQDTFEQDRYRRVPAEYVVHIAEPNRVGMLRCPTLFYAVLNKLHDMDDLDLMEMQAAKQAASVTEIIKTPSGELPDDGFETIDTSTDGTDATGANPRKAYYEQRFGAQTKVLFSGDEYQQIASNRPTVTQQWYWRYLAEQIATGSAGLPLAMIYPESMQGTVARGVLDQCATHMRARSGVIGNAFKNVRNYVVMFGAQTNAWLADKPADWRSCTVLPPKQANVDVGRNTAAMLAELQAGTRTFKDVFGEMQQDWRDGLTQKAREAAKINRLAKEYGVAPQAVTSFAVVTSANAGTGAAGGGGPAATSQKGKA